MTCLPHSLVLKLLICLDFLTTFLEAQLPHWPLPLHIFVTGVPLKWSDYIDQSFGGALHIKYIPGLD